MLDTKAASEPTTKRDPTANSVVKEVPNPSIFAPEEAKTSPVKVAKPVVSLPSPASNQ